MPTHENAVSTIQLDNDMARVAEWRFAPGTETGWHVHQFDYVVVPIIGGTMTIEHPDGRTEPVEIAVGTSYSRQAGVEHNVINDSGAEFAFVEIELKDRPLQR